jgi:hypothetical protein
MAEEQKSNEQNDGSAMSEDTFNEHVEYFSKKLTLDTRDLKETYKDKHESLKTLFKEAHAARTSVVPPIFVSALVCGITAMIYPDALAGAVPLSAVASYYFGKSDGETTQKVADIIRTEVSSYRHSSNVKQNIPALN